MSQSKNQNPLKALQEQYDLLRKEYEFEKETYMHQTRVAGIDKRVRQGKCWYPLTIGRSYHNSLNQLVVEIERTGDPGADHEFEPGRPVCFFDADMGGQPRYLNFTGTVNFVDDNRMVVTLPNVQALQLLQRSTDPGIQLYFDETSYNAMFTALSAVMNAKDNRLSHLRDVLIGNRPALFRSDFPVRFPWLNKSQEAAVGQVLTARETAIVHGPPGTGKTTTLVEAIYETLHREAQVMVCAQSNAAVDWICEKLMDRGVSVLRIGNPMRVNDKILSSTYERRFESHSDYSELWSLRKAIRESQSQLRKGGENRDSLRNRLSKLRSRATELEIRINEDIFAETRVVASTLVGASGKVLEFKHFPTLFIDEAAQALEAACWIAIKKADRVIFAGDHCQLPPTIKCYEAARGGLDRTLMQKVAETLPNTVSLLTLQYRMHESIMQFPSQWFYEGALQAAPEISQRTILSLDYPMVWYNTEACGFHEETSQHTLSRLNKAEAEQLVCILEDYIRRTGEERVVEERIDFGIISPYKSQVYYLRSLIKQNGFLRKFRKQISVNTVDGFQGQERDVILISMVRGNDEGKIGFLSDLRRMNVAITRARMKLMILGDASTLTHHAFYRKLYEHVERCGAIYQLQPPAEEKIN
ncbi:MAG: AAA domain-containing protein [Bacteroidales bacterium]